MLHYGVGNDIRRVYDVFISGFEMYLVDEAFAA
jgi:hypothetical protein